MTGSDDCSGPDDAVGVVCKEAGFESPSKESVERRGCRRVSGTMGGRFLSVGGCSGLCGFKGGTC